MKSKVTGAWRKGTIGDGKRWKARVFTILDQVSLEDLREGLKEVKE